MANATANERPLCPCGRSVCATEERLCPRCIVRERQRRPLKYIPTPEIDNIIRDAYARYRTHKELGAIKAAAKRLQWPQPYITNRAADLGIALTRSSRPWTDAEDQILETYGWMAAERAQEQLERAGYQRTVAAIKLRRIYLRVRLSGEWYSKAQLAEALGAPTTRITRWIERRLLPADNRRGVGGPYDAAVIHRRDVRKFLLAHPDEFDLARVQKHWFLDLIANGKVGKSKP